MPVGDISAVQRPTSPFIMDHVKAVVRPLSVADVVSLVHQARADKVPLYPVSRGMNWGYGGATPPKPGCIVVDLSGMNRIRNASAISLSNPVAVIEAGGHPATTA
jgi:4-cresol dehydrogenase (hydroxylating)